MAAGSLLAPLDDIATILDDVALLTKVAAKKTAGVLGGALAHEGPVGGGSILVHGIPALHHWVEAMTAGAGGFTATLAGLLVDGAAGIVAGGIAVGAATAGRKAMQGAQAH